MSRIGKQFVSIPEGVTAVLEGQKLSIFSSKGIFSRIVPSLVRCTLGCNLEDEKDGNQKLFLPLPDFGINFSFLKLDI